jgi:hypothetical protein
MLLSEKEFKRRLESCLQYLFQMSDNPLLDFHADYVQIRPAIRVALEHLQAAESLTYEVSSALATSLGFRRIYPLFEFVDKDLHIERRFIPELKDEVRRLEAWGVSAIGIEEVLKAYPDIVRNAFFEFIFRKAVGEMEVDAIRGIRYSMGNRFAEEYFYNIIKGWPYEDLVARWLDKRLSALPSVRNIERKNLAHDQDRVVRFRKRPTGEANFVVTLTFQGGNTLWFYLEVQTATERTVRRTTAEVEVPPHRIAQSRNAGGGKFLMVFPYKGSDPTGVSDEVAFVVDPHDRYREEKGRTFVKANFLSPVRPELDSELEKALAMLSRSSSSRLFP